MNQLSLNILGDSTQLEGCGETKDCNSFLWDVALEADVLSMRDGGASYASIGRAIGTTTSSVKHKVRRLQQSSNLDRYKHTSEKLTQIEKYLPSGELNILETHCGFGSLSEFYQKHGFIECYDIKKERVDFVNALGFEGIEAIKGDSEKELRRLVFSRCKYNVVDVDPYGFPSRFFPSVFELIDDGVLFLTFPVMGVAQINKIMVRHYSAFWGLSLKDKDCYIEKISNRLNDYAFMSGREVEILDVIKIDRIFRFAISVKKKSMLEIVGLKVNRNNRID